MVESKLDGIESQSFLVLKGDTYTLLTEGGVTPSYETHETYYGGEWESKAYLFRGKVVVLDDKGRSLTVNLESHRTMYYAGPENVEQLFGIQGGIADRAEAVDFIAESLVDKYIFEVERKAETGRLNGDCIVMDDDSMLLNTSETIPGIRRGLVERAMIPSSSDGQFSFPVVVN